MPAASVALNNQGDLSIASVVSVKRNRRCDFKETGYWRDLDVTRTGSLDLVWFGGLTPLSYVAQPL